MTSTKTTSTIAVLVVTLGLAAVSWSIAFWQMSGMDMVVITGFIVAQKLLPVRATIDVPLALTIVGLGVLIVIAPSAVPGLMPAM